MNKILQAVGITTWFLTACTAIGCSAGYESDVVLARSARLILGVKMKTVMDAVYDNDPFANELKRVFGFDRHFESMGFRVWPDQAG